jgi:dTDP-glucose 4,6-dehydratase
MASKKKVLVTGSAGFIFSNFIRWALRYHKENYEFVSIDKIALPESVHNVYANRGHKLHIGDVCDRHFVDVIFQLEQPDIVIHGAAESHVDNSIDSADRFVLSNILGTQVIIDKCREHGVKRLVYISTDEVYGQLSEGDESWTENSVLAPRNPYSASKAAGELLVKAAHETHGLEYNITRSCNNFGPRQSATKLIPKIIKCILEEAPIPIYGQGAQIREWIHVADNCSAIIEILKGPANETYNISSNYEMSNLELVNMICNIMDGGHSLITFVEDRAGHDFRYSVDNAKLKDLGWKPNFKFRDGLKHTCKWYSKNRWFVR